MAAPREAGAGAPRRLALPRPCLALIGDRRLLDPPSFDRLPAIVEAGVDLIQVRDKALTGAQLFVLTTLVLERLGGAGLVVVNERLDVAAAAGAHGVHLPENGLPVAPTVAIAHGLLVGRSVHDPGSAGNALQDGASYAQFGTLFPSRSKPGAVMAGIPTLADACALADGLVLAVGGIDATNAGSAIRAGAAGVAVISAIMDAPDPTAAAAAIKAAILAAWQSARTEPKWARDIAEHTMAAADAEQAQGEQERREGGVG